MSGIINNYRGGLIVNNNRRFTGRIGELPPIKPALVTKPIHRPFTQEPLGLGEATISVCQGLGDIFWVYQKFSPYLSKINFQILIVEDNDIQNRTIEWLKLFPKVGSVTTSKVTPQRYEFLARSYCTMENAWKQLLKGDDIEYCCNRWLESGIRIEEIDPYSTMDRSIDFKVQSFDLPFAEKSYLTLAVSGSTAVETVQNDPNIQAWSVSKWLNYMERLYNNYNLSLPVVLPGAKFDSPVPEQLAEGLDKMGIKTYVMIGQAPSKVMYMLKNSKFMVAYQSGLSIVAEDCDVPQAMMYFAYLKPMLYTWCKKESIGTKFHANTFDKTPEDVIKEHDLTNCFK